MERLSARLAVQAGFSVVLLRDDAIRSYNRKFRGKDYPTDVLSFPAEPEGPGAEEYLGDILISVEMADRQKTTDLPTELSVLCLHGLLHLMGLDHETDRGSMKRLEAKIKKEFQLR